MGRVSAFDPGTGICRRGDVVLSRFLWYAQARGVNLACVRSCVVVAEERPRLALTQSFSKLFKDLGLSPRAVSTAFGSRVNLAICLQVRGHALPRFATHCARTHADALHYELRTCSH